MQGVDYARCYSWARIVVDVLPWMLEHWVDVPLSFGEYAACVGGCKLLCRWVSRAPQHLTVRSTGSATGSFSLSPSWERTTSLPTAWFSGWSTLGSPPFSKLHPKSCISSVNRLSLSKAFSTDQVFWVLYLHCPLWHSLSLSIGKEQPSNMWCSH